MTAYLSQAARDQIEAAQAVLEEHSLSRTRRDGRCPICLVTAPCPTQERAAEIFVKYGQLPRRRPGSSLTASPGSFGWFESMARRS
jgi:hypothetical protein